MSDPGCLYYKTEAGDVVPVARLPKVILQPPSPASGWVRMSSPEGNSQAPGWGWGNGVPFVFQSTDATQAGPWFTTNANQTITILEDGVYDLSVYFRWWVAVAWPSPANPAGVRAGVYLNGNHVPVFQTGDTWSGSGPTEIATSHMMALSAGDVLGAVFEFNLPAGNFGEVPTGGFFQVTRIPMEGIKGDKGDPGDVSLAQLNALPKGKVAFVQAVANQVGIAAETDLTGLSVTWTAVAGRAYKISGLVRAIQRGAGGGAILVRISDAANVGIAATQATTLADTFASLTPWAVVAPAAGVVTYKLRMSSGSGTADTAASATAPALLLVEDVGPA